MRSNYEHAVHALIPAVEAWRNEHGEHMPMPALAQHLGEWLTDRGWVQIHNQDSHAGKQQLAVAEAKIHRGMNNKDSPPRAIASDVFVGLLNPQEGTR